MRWRPGCGETALLQPTVCLPVALTLNLKSSWLVEPFMVNDWEKLRKKQREFRILRTYALALGALDPWVPKSRQI